MGEGLKASTNRVLSANSRAQLPLSADNIAEVLRDFDAEVLEAAGEHKGDAIPGSANADPDKEGASRLAV